MLPFTLSRRFSPRNPAESAATAETLIARRPRPRRPRCRCCSYRRFLSLNVLIYSSRSAVRSTRDAEAHRYAQAHIFALSLDSNRDFYNYCQRKSASLPRPGRRGVDTTPTTLARHPRSTLSHPGIFAAHSRLRPCCRDSRLRITSRRRICSAFSLSRAPGDFPSLSNVRGKDRRTMEIVASVVRFLNLPSLQCPTTTVYRSSIL